MDPPPAYSLPLSKAVEELGSSSGCRRHVRIPNKSPSSIPEWEKHGYMEQAANLIADWCRRAAHRG